tara:strand:- start:3 stop:278 length:276 start_codon:yes stop_codon:yes gene_type:complete
MRKDIPSFVTKLANSDGLEVSVRIGKGGITESLISELSEQLSRRRIVKVKANKGIVPNRENRNSFFSEIATKSSSQIVFQRGNVAVFWSGK